MRHFLNQQHAVLVSGRQISNRDAEPYVPVLRDESRPARKVIHETRDKERTTCGYRKYRGGMTRAMSTSRRRLSSFVRIRVNSWALLERNPLPHEYRESTRIQDLWNTDPR